MATKKKTKPQLIFIVGIPRSGTSWVLSKFEARSDCICITPKVLNVAFNGVTREGRLFFSGLTDGQIVKKVEKLLQSGKHVVEKTPSNLENIERIRKLFPYAKIILVTRNCDGTLLSLRKWLDNPKNFTAVAQPNEDPDEVAYREYERWYNHQTKYLDDDWDCIVRFEDMQDHEQVEAERVFKTIGIEP